MKSISANTLRLLRHWDPRILVPALIFTWIMVVFSLQRLLLFILMPERFDPASFVQLVRAFVVGLRFDAVVACMVSAVAVALLTPLYSGWIKRWRWLRGLIVTGVALVMSMTVFFVLVDFYFFKQFDQRLNYKALVYLDESSTLAVIWGQWPVLPVALSVLVLFGVIVFAAGRVLFAAQFKPLSLRLIFLWLLVVVPALVLGIRSSLGPKAINQGPAFFSNFTSLSQLALNGGFTLREAAWSLYVRHESLRSRVDVPADAQSFEITRRLLATPNDRFLGDEDNPLRRETVSDEPRKDYNVVLVVMESLGWSYIGEIGGDARLTPNLDRLIREGVFMEQCYAVGRRTTAGFSGIVCGYPDLPGESVTTRPETLGRFQTLGQVLADRGYQTMFIYGGQPMYDHRQSFLRSNGYQRIITQDDFAFTSFRSHLGWSDEDLYRQADQVFRAAGDRPFFATLLTLSFHRPYTIPKGRIEPVDPDDPDAEKYDAIRYSDWALGQFMQRARESDYFDDTIFVFVADHMGDFGIAPIEPHDYRVPFLIYAPALLGQEGRRISTVCSQTDVAPTIMALLGGRYTHSFFGSDVLSRRPEDGFAIFQDSSTYIGMIDGGGRVVQLPFNAPPRFSQMVPPDRTLPVRAGDQPDHAEVMSRRTAAVLRSAEILFKRDAYRMRPATSAGQQATPDGQVPDRQPASPEKPPKAGDG